MKQYKILPDNSGWLDRGSNVDFILKVLFSLCIIATFCTRAKAQKYDCNAHPLSVVGSLEMGIHKGMITQSFKVGLWQNNKPNGFTLLGGYQIGVTTFNSKNEQTSQVNTFFGEFGYKMRVAKPVILHGYGGVNLVGKYVGGAGYITIQEDLMVGVYYKQGIYGATLLFAF